MAAFLRIDTLLVILSCCHFAWGLRRILNGTETNKDKRYMVYLVKSPESSVNYDAWLCGGTLVAPQYVLTSAACLEDVQFMYAVAGYRNYVNGLQIYQDACANAVKKKVIMTCVPKMYNFAYEEIQKWVTLDIGLAKLEAPVDTAQAAAGCSYAPATLPVNYMSKYQQPGTDAFVMGWGHGEIFRDVSDTKDYNQRSLLYVPVLLVENEVCKKAWAANLSQVIDKYMLCSAGAGQLNSDGEVIAPEQLLESCRRSGDPNCRRFLQGVNLNSTGLNESVNFNYTRRNGFCQNDHGGPLISWVGGKEILLGVQSAFLLDSQRHCRGPFLYTSTHCNGAFLDCILNKGKTLRINCHQPAEELGFHIDRRTISWKDHPDGPAMSEKESLREGMEDQVIALRPQVPLGG